MSNLKTRKYAYGVVALSAWTGFGLSVIIETFGLVKPKLYDPPIPASQFAYFENYQDGLAGAPERLIDLLSYFTIWSQIVVGIVATLLFLNPNRDGKLFRVVFLDAVLMITVTGVVYNLLLGPNYPPQGLNKISSPIEHTWTPIFMVVAFLLFGPRGWIKASIIPKVLALPIIYVVYTLLRGAVINSYPYDFFDVVSYGYAYVLIFVASILAASLVVLSLFWFIDSRVRSR